MSSVELNGQKMETCEQAGATKPQKLVQVPTKKVVGEGLDLESKDHSMTCCDSMTMYDRSLQCSTDIPSRVEFNKI